MQSVRDGDAAERGDFLGSAVRDPYSPQSRPHSNPTDAQGSARGMPVKITKGVTAESGSSTLEIAYLLEGLPAKQPLHFGVEFNFAGLPSRANDRFFFQGDYRPLGELQTELDLEESRELCLTDQWLGLDVRIVGRSADRLVDVSDRDGQQLGRGFRAGPPVGGGAAPLDRSRRRHGPVERDGSTGTGHQPG